MLQLALSLRRTVPRVRFALERDCGPEMKEAFLRGTSRQFWPTNQSMQGCFWMATRTGGVVHPKILTSGGRGFQSPGE